jgi:hypothetical protein
MVKNILVAIDSFETTTIASPLIKKTIELANAFSSKVWILHVVPQSRQPPYNIESTSLLVEGATIKTILHESDRLAVDLIILGCHRHSELFGALMNGTDEGILSKCTHPVMFVPMPE